jgi:3-oxoacyl-[acyl-carrier protein] reductase
VEYEIKGKSALVTGASRGIGAATALVLARNGVRRFQLQYNSNEQGVNDLVRSLGELGAEATAIQADFSRMDGIRAFLQKLDPKVDILINNAGHLVQRARLLEADEDLYDRVMNLNTKSAWMITQAVAPHMIEQGSGAIVFLSSIAARNGGGVGATLYSASKAAIACMTKGIAKELAPKGIRVNGVSPGTVDNYFHQKYSTRAILDSMLAQTPAGKLGTNEEVADTILFLCSEASRFIYGQTIEINGGMYMV